MAYKVNGQLVPEQFVHEEFLRIGRDPRWNAITDMAERARQIRAAAEQRAINRVLIEQAAMNDPRPIDDAAIDEEIRKQTGQWGCRAAFDPAQVRPLAERNLRLERIRKEMLASAVKPTLEEMQAFFNANRANFPKRPEMFRASHIVKYVNPEHSAEQAEAGIEAAQGDLDRGVPFDEAADRHSDCKDKGGDIGQFPAGVMVQEFDDAIRELEPGQRTGIFTTPLGFHIAMLHSKQPVGDAEFEDVRSGIEELTTYIREDEAYTRSIGEMRAHAEIIWVPDEPSRDHKEAVAST